MILNCNSLCNSVHTNCFPVTAVPVPVTHELCGHHSPQGLFLRRQLIAEAGNHGRPVIWEIGELDWARPSVDYSHTEQDWVVRAVRNGAGRLEIVPCWNWVRAEVVYSQQNESTSSV